MENTTKEEFYGLRIDDEPITIVTKEGYELKTTMKQLQQGFLNTKTEIRVIREDK